MICLGNAAGGGEQDREERFEQVADGVAGCICPASMVAFYRRPDLVWVPIADIEPLSIALAWLEGQETPMVESFADAVRDVAAEWRGRTI